MAITATRITATPPTATRPTAMQINAGGGGEVCRNVSNFNGVDSYAEFDNDIVLSGDFYMSMFVDITLRTQIILGNLSTTNPSLILRDISFGELGLRNDSGVDVRFTLLESGISGLLEIERVSNTVEMKFNGVSLGTDTLSGAITLNVIGRYQTAVGFHMEGTFADLVINTSFDVDLPMNEGTAGQTGTVNYINRTGNTDYNATGYNITVTEECEGDASAWNDAEDWVDDEEYID